MAAIEFEDPLGDVVEEVAIVRDRDDGGWIGLQVLLEPRNRFGVEMVGGLVQQQHVGRGQQQAAQRHAAFLAARELVDDGVPGRQAQRIRGDLELALEFPAADRVDGVLQLGLLLEELVHLLVIHRLGELVADLVEARDLRERAAQTFHHDAAHVLVRVELGLLRQVADLDAGLRARLAFEIGVDAAHDLEQRGFARAVEAEHADLGAGKERETDVAQDDAFGWHNLANPVHRVDVLGHVLLGFFAGETGREFYLQPPDGCATFAAPKRPVGSAASVLSSVIGAGGGGRAPGALRLSRRPSFRAGPPRGVFRRVFRARSRQARAAHGNPRRHAQRARVLPHAGVSGPGRRPVHYRRGLPGCRRYTGMARRLRSRRRRGRRHAAGVRARSWQDAHAARSSPSRGCTTRPAAAPRDSACSTTAAWRWKCSGATTA